MMLRWKAKLPMEIIITGSWKCLTNKCALARSMLLWIQMPRETAHLSTGACNGIQLWQMVNNDELLSQSISLFEISPNQGLMRLGVCIRNTHDIAVHVNTCACMFVCVCGCVCLTSTGKHKCTILVLFYISGNCKRLEYRSQLCNICLNIGNNKVSLISCDKGLIWQFGTANVIVISSQNTFHFIL